MAKITEYPVTTEIANDDVLLVDGAGGTRGLSVSGFSEAVAQHVVNNSQAFSGLVGDVNDLKSDLNDTITELGATLIGSSSVGRYNERVDIISFAVFTDNVYEVEVALAQAASADVYAYVKDQNNDTVVQVRIPTGETVRTMTFSASDDATYIIIALPMATMSNNISAKIKNKSGFVQSVENDVVNVYGTGLIYPVTTSGGNFVMQIAENAVINYKLRNGTSKSKAIAASTSYTITPQDALIIDSNDNEIKQVNRGAIKTSYVVLLKTGQYVANYSRYFEGYFADRVTVTTQYENILLHNVSPDYVRNVDDVIAEIVNDNPCDFSAIIGTDMHIPTQTAYATNRPILNVINRVQNAIRANAVLNLGDNVAMGKENPNEAYYSMQDAVGKIEDYANAYFVVGNHDYNNISGVSVDRQKMEWIIPDDAIYRMYGRMHENDVVWGSKEKVYYYKDFNDQKIRMIVLNTLDKPSESVTIDGIAYEKYPWLPNIVSADQVDWFIDEALDFSDKSDKTDWAVIVLSHVTPAPNVEWNSASLGDLQNPNPEGAQIIKIAEAFITGTAKTLSYTDSLFGGNATLNRTADFTAQGGIPIIGWFSGHNHIDTKTTINGVTYVTTVAGYPDASIGNSQSMSGMEMIEGTYSAFGVDVMSVDRTARKVKLHRIGIGNDREWTY